MCKFSRSILNIILIPVCIIIQSCQHRSASGNIEILHLDSLIPIYSHAFRVDYYNGFKVVSLLLPDSNKIATQYILCPRSFSVPDSFDSAIRIDDSVSRIVCLSTTHIGALSILNAREKIVAATNHELICDTLVNAMYRAGIIKDAGKNYQPDYEMIALVKPDLLFSDGENTGSSQLFAKLKAMKIKVVSSRDYFEQEPLARAEWIKFFAVFINQEKKADSIFHKVAIAYRQAKSKIPAYDFYGYRVFCNLPYGGVWYMPCGENYVAKLIDDANGKFLWAKEKPINGLNLSLNFEQVYERAVDADIWLNPGTARSLSDISAQDGKFKLFRAFREGQVYNCTKRMSARGGMDIWETGSFRPDIVLNDMIQICTPSHPTTDLYYYEQLK